MSDIITELFATRSESDYDDDFDFNVEYVTRLVVKAEKFYKNVETYLKQKQN